MFIMQKFSLYIYKDGNKKKLKFHRTYHKDFNVKFLYMRNSYAKQKIIY